MFIEIQYNRTINFSFEILDCEPGFHDYLRQSSIHSVHTSWNRYLIDQRTQRIFVWSLIALDGCPEPII